MTGKSYANYEWWTTTNYSGAVIAQDTCNTVRFYLRYQGTQPPFLPCFGNGGIWIADLADVTVQPRTAVTLFFSGGGTGICDYHFAYSTTATKLAGPNGARLGMVIRPKPAQPSCPSGCICDGDVHNCPR